MIPKPLFVFEPNAQLCALVTRHAARQHFVLEAFPVPAEVLLRSVALAEQHGQSDSPAVAVSPCSALLLNLDAGKDAQHIVHRIREFESARSLVPTFLAGYTMSVRFQRVALHAAGLDRVFGTGLDPEWLDGFARDPRGFREREI